MIPFKVGDKVQYETASGVHKIDSIISIDDRFNPVLVLMSNLDNVQATQLHIPGTVRNIDSAYAWSKPTDLPREFEDYKEIIKHGEQKYGTLNWLEPNGKKSSLKDMHASMFRHLAESSAGIREDHESGLDPLLHLITRAQMIYTRIKRNIKHKEDAK